VNIILGISPDVVPTDVCRLVGRIGFVRSIVTCACFGNIPTLIPAGAACVPDDSMSVIVKDEEDHADRMTRQAKELLAKYAIACDEVFSLDCPADGLLSLAKETSASLIAIQSHQWGIVKSALLGSVGRSLTINSDRSVLVAKHNVSAEGPLKAVFAFDGSEYANRCIDLLGALQPQGFSEVVIVIVDRPFIADSPLIALRREEAWRMNEDARTWALLECAQSAADRLVRRGISAHARCLSGSVSECLEQACVDADAELLIVGAKGHSWLDRLFSGSTSLEAVLASSRSVLVLRPTDPA